MRSRPGERQEREAAEPVASIASDEERLAGKSFDSLDPDELAALYRLMSRLDLATPLRRTRRFERARHGRRVDLRRTLRASLRTGGDPIEIAHRRRRVRRRSLVMLCDISGSMEPYARAYLQFLSCAAGTGGRTEAFVFATRLTRLTRALATRRPEQAMQRAAATAPDWSSGTRIGEALKQFNDRYGRRGMARGAVVVILSDGWERGDPAVVGREMERLARLAHKIVWVNPRLSAREFSVGAAGMRAALRALRCAGQRPQLRSAGGGRRRDRGAAGCEPGAHEPRSGCLGRAGRGVVAERHPGARKLGRDAERPRPEPGPDDARMGGAVIAEPKICIYPGCDRPAVPPHPLGGPQPAFCDLEEHNALSAHQERRRLESKSDDDRDEEDDDG